MIKSLYLSISLIFLIAGQTCKRQSVDLSLKLSPFVAIGADSTLYFIYGFQDGQSIFSMDLRTSEVTQLTDRKEYFNFLTLSSDNSILAYITSEKDSIKGFYTGISMMNTNGTEKRMVRGIPAMVVGLCFSPKNDRLYFAGALEFKNYSIVAKPGFHNMDFLYTDTSGSELELISNLGAYGIYSPFQVTSDGQYILCNITLNEKLMGAVKIPTDSITNENELENYLILSKADADIIKPWSKLSTSSHNFFTPFYSADGENLYFYNGGLIFKKRKGESIRLLFDSSKRKVNDEYGIRTVTMFPSGKQLLVIRENGPDLKDTGMYILDAETGEIVDEIVLDMSAFGSVVVEDTE